MNPKRLLMSLRILDVICDSCQCVGFVADCRHSDIARLSNSSTTEHRRLRVLLLANNTLEVTTYSFRGLHWLGRLELRYNGIEVVPEGAFRDLLNLRELDLSWNQLQGIDAAVFLGLKSLRILDLSHNRLVTLRSSTFSRLPALERLLLNDNNLQDVAVDTFTAAVRLKVGTRFTGLYIGQNNYTNTNTNTYIKNLYTQICITNIIMLKYIR